MNILYIYAHPNPNSFNALLKDAALQQLHDLDHQVVFVDLYQEQFNPVASWQDFTIDESNLNSQYFLAQQEAFQKKALTKDILRHIENVQQADHIIFQFPLWWFKEPAILKGWFDRILVKGFAYDAGKIFENGLLTGKSASLSVTTQSPESAFDKNSLHGATLETFLHPTHHTLKFVGIICKEFFAAYGMFNLDDTRKKEVIKNYQHYLAKL